MRKTVLIVNSHSAERDTLQRFFAAADYDVLTTFTGAEALELCRSTENSIQLLVTDIDLSDSPGWKLAETAIKIRPGLMVMFLPAAQFTPQHLASPRFLTPAMLLQVTQALARRVPLQKHLN